MSGTGSPRLTSKWRAIGRGLVGWIGGNLAWQLVVVSVPTVASAISVRALLGDNVVLGIASLGISLAAMGLAVWVVLTQRSMTRLAAETGEPASYDDVRRQHRDPPLSVSTTPVVELTPEYMTIGEGTQQVFSHDTFGFGLLVTNHGPTVELVISIRSQSVQGLEGPYPMGDVVVGKYHLSKSATAHIDFARAWPTAHRVAFLQCDERPSAPSFVSTKVSGDLVLWNKTNDESYETPFVLDLEDPVGVHVPALVQPL